MVLSTFSLPNINKGWHLLCLNTPSRECIEHFKIQYIFENVLSCFCCDTFSNMYCEFHQPPQASKGQNGYSESEGGSPDKETSIYRLTTFKGTKKKEIQYKTIGDKWVAFVREAPKQLFHSTSKEVEYIWGKRVKGPEIDLLHSLHLIYVSEMDKWESGENATWFDVQLLDAHKNGEGGVFFEKDFIIKRKCIQLFFMCVATELREFEMTLVKKNGRGKMEVDSEDEEEEEEEEKAPVFDAARSIKWYRFIPSFVYKASARLGSSPFVLPNKKVVLHVQTHAFSACYSQLPFSGPLFRARK